MNHHLTQQNFLWHKHLNSSSEFIKKELGYVETYFNIQISFGKGGFLLINLYIIWMFYVVLCY